MFKIVYGNEALSRSHVLDWCQRFSEEPEDLEDDSEVSSRQSP
jgi:hypothetical protein